MGEREVLVTTSWDDGHPHDHRVGDLLAKHGIPGCFYIPRSNPERQVMETTAIRALAARFPVGGHTLHHLPLTSLSPREAEIEIRDCRPWLEDVAGRAVNTFCYVGGHFSAAHAAAAAAAGYRGARTADWMRLDLGRDPYRIAPSLHLYPHGVATHVAHCVRRRHGLALFLGRLRRTTDLTRLAELMGERVSEDGGALHVWGHSWEIDALGLWQQLDRVLGVMASLVRRGATPVDDAQLAERIRARRPGS